MSAASEFSSCFLHICVSPASQAGSYIIRRLFEKAACFDSVNTHDPLNDPFGFIHGASVFFKKCLCDLADSELAISIEVKRAQHRTLKHECFLRSAIIYERTDDFGIEAFDLVEVAYDLMRSACSIGMLEIAGICSYCCKNTICDIQCDLSSEIFDEPVDDLTGSS